MQIKNRYTDAVIFEDDKPTLRETVLNAVAQKAYLAGAYLAGAYLAGADLADADLARADLAGANLGGQSVSGCRRQTGAQIVAEMAGEGGEKREQKQDEPFIPGLPDKRRV